MVAGLQILPVFLEHGVFAAVHLLAERIKFVYGFVLHLVAQPRRGVALLVDPACGVGHVDGRHGLKKRHDLARCLEHEVLVGQDGVGQCLQEFHDSGFGLVVGTERFVVDKNVDELFVFGQSRQPAFELVGSQRPLTPTAVAKAQGNVVAQRIVLEQNFQLRLYRVAIQIVRTLPAQHLLGTLGQHCLEAHVGNHLAEAVGINQFCVAEHGGRLAEELFDGLDLLGHLAAELLLVAQRGQRVCRRLGEELDLLGGGQGLEAVDYLRRVCSELCQKGSRNGESHREFALVLLYGIEQNLVGRQIARVRKPVDGALVGVVVVVVVVIANVEEAIATQTNWLVQLEI